MFDGQLRLQRGIVGLFHCLIVCCSTWVNAQSLIKNGGFEDAGDLIEVADPNNPGGTIMVLPGVVDHNVGYEPRFVSDPPMAGDIYVLNDNSTAIGNWQVDIEDEGATIDWVHELAVGSSQGERPVDLNGTPGQGIIWQQFRTIPGLNYVVTFDMASNPAVLGLEQVGTGTVTQYTTMLDIGIQAAPAISTDYSFSPAATTSFSHSVFQGTHSISDPGWESKQWTFTASGVASALGFKSLTAEFDRDVSGLPPEEQQAAKLLTLDRWSITYPCGSRMGICIGCRWPPGMPNAAC